MREMMVCVLYSTRVLQRRRMVKIWLYQKHDLPDTPDTNTSPRLFFVSNRLVSDDGVCVRLISLDLLLLFLSSFCFFVTKNSVLAFALVAGVLVTFIERLSNGFLSLTDSVDCLGGESG